MIPGALVLCGGRSLRMGRPKAWLPFGQERLLQRVVRLVGQAAGPVVVVAAEGQALPELPETVAIVRDPIEDRGPLQGIAAGLAALPNSVELVFATATDAPFLRPDWIGRLANRIGDHDLAIPRVDGRDHPLAALYRRSAALAVARELLSSNQFRLGALTDRLRARRLPVEEFAGLDPTLETLRNLNTPEDYRQALLDAGLPIPEVPERA